MTGGQCVLGSSPEEDKEKYAGGGEGKRGALLLIISFHSCSGLCVREQFTWNQAEVRIDEEAIKYVY